MNNNENSQGERTSFLFNNNLFITEKPGKKEENGRNTN